MKVEKTPLKYGNSLIEGGEEGYLYTLKGEEGYGDCSIAVRAEIGGHGCLYEILLPPKISSGYFTIPNPSPTLQAFLTVLQAILKDYNANATIVKGFKDVAVF